MGFEHSPKLQGIVEEVKDNPMSGLKYMSDPDVAPFMKKAMAKIMPGGLPGLGGDSKGGKGAGRGKGAGGGGADLGGLADMMKGFGAGGDSVDLSKLADMMKQGKKGKAEL